MTSIVNKKCKHLTRDERDIIETLLTNGSTLSSIATTISRDITTISKEIKKHRQLKLPDKFNNQNNLCIHRKSCKMFDCNESKECFDMICPLLKKSPYVCNGCEKRVGCRNAKYYYYSKNAYNEYEDTLSLSRSGVRISKEEEKEIENVIYDLIKNKNQSINEIYINNPDLLTFSKPTLYSYIDQGLFNLKNHDLRRKVKYKPRKNGIKKTRKESKIRIGRTYKDFINFISLHPNMNIVEMDCVEGYKGGKVFLTFAFRKYNLLLIFLLENQNVKCVLEVFDYLKNLLGKDLFKKLFRIILTDNGSEFFDPDNIERINGKKQINLFYCDPGKSYQKGKIEKLHEYIRYVLPQGFTFDYITQEDVNILMSNINNSSRLSSGKHKSPYLAFKEEYGLDILNLLNISYIKPNEVDLSKNLLTLHRERKKILAKLIKDLDNYNQVKHLPKLDYDIKKHIINYYINDYYKYREEDLFYNSLEIINNYNKE